MQIIRKLHKYIFERFVGRIFFQRGTAKKNIITRLNQKINEKGLQAPWIYTKEECFTFWKTTPLGSSNSPAKYANKDISVVKFLHFFWDTSYDNSILELGCSAGGNLGWLKKLGYTNLKGIDINPESLTYSKIDNIIIGEIGQVLKTLPDKSVDMILTMGVLMHIHPHDNYIFKEMERVGKAICVIESETANSNYVFARDYSRVFHNQIKHSGYEELTGRLFK